MVAGTIAASFAVEQIGLPEMHYENSHELWNGTTFESRLSEYVQMIESQSEDCV